MQLATSQQQPVNNILLLRYAAALLVIATHCVGLSGHFSDEPLWRMFPETNMGLLGVQIFFVLSGVLITQSWLRRPSLRVFIIARVLRIYPALIAATLFTIIVAGLWSTLPLAQFLVHEDTLRYLWHTASGLTVTDLLPGAFTSNPFAFAANGSLWTLPVELRLYLLIAVAGVAGMLRRPVIWLVCVSVLAMVALLVPSAWLLDLSAANFRGPAALFVLGSLACVFARRVPLSLPAALACIALYVWNPAAAFRGMLALPMLAYVVLVAAYHPMLIISRRLPATRIDLSYGMYVFAFPIQQAIVAQCMPIGPIALMALALPCIVVVAFGSWHFIEAPALALKSRVLRSDRESNP